MKPNDICKEVFSLAVRLLGLYFLYLGLKDLNVPALMDLTIIKGDNMNDIFSAALSVVFNLAVAWWLLGSRSLTLRAYPVISKILDCSGSPVEQVSPASRPSPAPELTDIESAEKKLAALLKTPKVERAA
jgi:hypothetical protein